MFFFFSDEEKNETKEFIRFFLYLHATCAGFHSKPEKCNPSKLSDF
jgi:hypothetical protein